MSELNGFNSAAASGQSSADRHVVEALTKVGICVRNMALMAALTLVQESAAAAFDAVSLVLLQVPEVVIAVADNYLGRRQFPLDDWSVASQSSQRCLPSGNPARSPS